MSGRCQAVDISLIVNTFQKPRHLALVLASIAAQEGVAGRFEVIVTDDGSTDDTHDIVQKQAATEQFPLRFTTQPHDGFRLARIRNNGARLAVGNSLLFLDGDCILPRDHVAAYLKRRRRGVAHLGYCARLSADISACLTIHQLANTDLLGLSSAAERHALRRRWRKAWWHNTLRHPSKPPLAGGNFCVWRDDFERLNGFDERFVGWGQEDDDLGLRLRALGIRLESILDDTHSLHVWHPSDPSATKRWRDGPTVHYFLRRGRLTICRHGLNVRPVNALRWGLPPDIGQTPAGQNLLHALNGCQLVHADEPCEIDVVVRPGVGRFHRRSECRLLLLTENAVAKWNLRRCADRIETIQDQSVERLLETIG